MFCDLYICTCILSNPPTLHLDSPKNKSKPSEEEPAEKKKKFVQFKYSIDYAIIITKLCVAFDIIFDDCFIYLI